MKQERRKKPTPEQIRNMLFAEKYFQLLDTIRDMVSEELDRRGLKGNENEQPDSTMSPPEELPHGEKGRHHHTCMQRFLDLFRSNRPTHNTKEH